MRRYLDAVGVKSNIVIAKFQKLVNTVKPVSTESLETNLFSEDVLMLLNQVAHTACYIIPIFLIDNEIQNFMLHTVRYNHSV
jgi:hypothetical protein